MPTQTQPPAYARIAHLEQQVDQLQRDNDGLRTALRYVIDETLGVFDALERQTETGKTRLDRTLTRQFTDTRLINELTQHGCDRQGLVATRRRRPRILESASRGHPATALGKTGGNRYFRRRSSGIALDAGCNRRRAAAGWSGRRRRRGSPA